ncbi:amino acid ABC transporter substrate-binding protein [Bacterioplanes sanyensis]|uniref:Amino acid ABC transporter substrate-binding protein n=2 Tax=Bacterioplanes sanyensis TaxID=1249553 RepID=A0A222FPL8_9GAMM|nr:amino acid ABC transporter substrate-binding protein [Bacterioplanes sanyensis]
MQPIWAAEMPKVRLYTEQFPPYNMTSNSEPFAHSADDIMGLCTDLVEAIMNRAEVKFEMRLRNWSAGLSRASQKPNHGLFCMARNEERDKQFEMVGPLTSLRWTLFAAPGSDIKVKSLEEAKKYTIGGYDGDAMTEKLQKMGLNISSISNDRFNPRRLELGQIDLWISDRLSGPYVAADAFDIVDMVPVLEFERMDLYLGMNPETDPRVLDRIKEAFRTLKSNGTISDMVQGYGL